MSENSVEKINVSGLSELQKFLDTLAPRLQMNVMRGALHAGLSPIQAVAKAHIHNISGKLSAGLHITTRVRYGQVMARLVTEGQHGGLAHLVEFGTAPHDIEPKLWKSLFIYGRYWEVVHHPGAKEKPFMRPAFDSQKEKAVLVAAEFIKRRLATKYGLDTRAVEIGESE